MKRISTLSVLLCSVFFGCSKDFLKSYDTRIVGTWHISEVNRVGFGGDTDNLAFTNGTFNFLKNGTLTYVNDANVNYKGSWDISYRQVDDERVKGSRLQLLILPTRTCFQNFMMI